jgi:hypothetical protein
VQLPSGKVLVSGGSGDSAPQSSAEVYDLATGKWSAVKNMTSGRIFHKSTILNDGGVMAFGGTTSKTSERWFE